MKRVVGLTLLVLCVAVHGKADTVVLKTGEQLKGDWKQVKGGNLVFKSEGAGEVTIPLAKVQSLTPDKPVVLVKKSGEEVRGQLSIQPSGDWEVKTSSGSQVVPASTVDGIYPEATYKPPEAKRWPWQGWKGVANLGYGLQRGDQNASSISVGVNAIRQLPDRPGHVEHWRTSYLLNMLFASTETKGVRVSSNNLTTNLREDYLLTPLDFLFVMGQLDHVQAQSLELRQTYGGGYGRELVHRPHLSLSLLGGATYVHEQFFTGPIRESFELLAGEKFDVDLTKQVHFQNILNVYPNMSDLGQYRFDTTSALSVRLSSRLSLNAMFTDLYLSNPIPGGMKNNLSLTMGLGFNF